MLKGTSKTKAYNSTTLVQYETNANEALQKLCKCYEFTNENVKYSRERNSRSFLICFRKLSIKI